MPMRPLVLLLALAAFAVAAPSASAQYTITNDGTSVTVAPGAQSSIQVDYSTFCFFVCPTTQSVGSTNGVAFTDNAANCSDASGGDNTTFNCLKRTRMNVTGTSSADSVSGTCFGANAALFFNALGGDDTVSAATCTGGTVDMGDGNDTAAVGGTLNGGAGTDSLNGSAAIDTIDGGDGRDSVNGQGGNDTVRGGSGRDLLVGGAGADVIEGGADTDTGSYEDRDGSIQ